MLASFKKFLVNPTPSQHRWLCVAAVIMYLAIIAFYITAFAVLLCNIIFSWTSALEPTKQALVLIAVGILIQTVSKIAWEFAFKGVNPRRDYASLVSISFIAMVYGGAVVFTTFMVNSVLFWIGNFWSLRVSVVIFGILLLLSYLTKLRLD